MVIFCNFSIKKFSHITESNTPCNKFQNNACPLYNLVIIHVIIIVLQSQINIDS